uniref:Vezatin n=1 Tax=Pavo cristatus TaxID=9049 RepID=A0A8C9FH83_PAVCR
KSVELYQKLGLSISKSSSKSNRYHFSLISRRQNLCNDVGFRFDTLRTILQQEVLLQEDVELIEFLDPSILSAGQCKQQENGQLPTLRSLATPNIWDISLLLAFVSALLMLPSWWKESSWLPWGLVLLVYAVFRVWATWRTAKLQMSLQKYCTQLEETVANSRAFTNLVRKALRLIQETEVISRGFTLVSAACPLNKAGQHPSQHLIGLRKAVYRSVRANFRASRLATLYMLKKYPFCKNPSSDNVTSYICVVPFKDLGLGLSEEQVSEEEAHNLTDGFSLPALKVLFQLWVGQSSEFFRRLVLLLSPANASPKPLISPERLPHHILSDVTQGLPHTHAACLEELKRSYEFYRYFETQHQSGFERPTRTKQKSRELNSLQTAVRSLQLHLKALLNEVIILEDELEKLVSTKETPELTTEAHQVLEQKLKYIQPHMQASNSCWEEAISQVEKMSGRNPNKKAAVKPLSPVESLKLLNNLESHMNSNTEKQDCSQSCDKSEESDSNSEVNAAGKSRTEYLYEEPEMERNKDSPTEEGISTEAEEIMCYRYEGEVEDLKPSDTDRVEVSQLPSVDALHSKIKHRLAQLHISTDFNFTSGLAAQAAARSFSFTTMQEQTFGDDDEDEEEEKEEGKGQEHEDLMEDFENEGSGSESEGKVQV